MPARRPAPPITYRRAGFSASARDVDTFGVTFVTAKHRGRVVLGASGRGGRRTRIVETLASPAVAASE